MPDNHLYFSHFLCLTPFLSPPPLLKPPFYCARNSFIHHVLLISTIKIQHWTIYIILEIMGFISLGFASHLSFWKISFVWFSCWLWSNFFLVISACCIWLHIFFKYYFLIVSFIYRQAAQRKIREQSNAWLRMLYAGKISSE